MFVLIAIPAWKACVCPMRASFFLGGGLIFKQIGVVGALASFVLCIKTVGAPLKGTCVGCSLYSFRRSVLSLSLW